MVQQTLEVVEHYCPHRELHRRGKLSLPEVQLVTQMVLKMLKDPLSLCLLEIYHLEPLTQ